MTSGPTPLRGMVYGTMFAARTPAGTMVTTPLYPVPVTLQALFTFPTGPT